MTPVEITEQDDGGVGHHAVGRHRPPPPLPLDKKKPADTQRRSVSQLEPGILTPPAAQVIPLPMQSLIHQCNTERLPPPYLPKKESDE